MYYLLGFLHVCAGVYVAALVERMEIRRLLRPVPTAELNLCLWCLHGLLSC